jgi:hypothetical protein
MFAHREPQKLIAATPHSAIKVIQTTALKEASLVGSFVSAANFAATHKAKNVSVLTMILNERLMRCS